MRNLLIIVNGVALVSTIIINYVSNTGAFNGSTMSTISNRYFNYFTPEGYAFSIWGLIYLGLLSMAFYTGRALFKRGVDNSEVERMGWWFLISCIANSFWVITWLNNQLLISVILMFVLLISLIKITLNLGLNITDRSVKSHWFVHIPFALYLGWISVAAIANISAYLVSLNWDGFGISGQMWAIIMVVVAGLLNLILIFKRNLYVCGWVGVWAIIAISVSNRNINGSEQLVYVCYGVAAIVLLVSILNFLKTQKESNLSTDL